jgi:dephospho-CoA kinase
MIVAGVTGGIGSGKSTFCREWEELGARVIYADDLAKEIMVSDPGLKQALRNTFGDETYNSDGSLNKPHLIREAFEKNRVDELNAIVHPAMRRAFSEICKEAESEGIELIVKEAAVLLNEGRPDGLDLVIIITAPEEERIRRVTERDRVSDREVKARLKKQPDFSELAHLADYVVVNDGSADELKEKARALYREITG